MKHPEDTLQKSIIQYLRIAAPNGLLYFHVPNGGKRSASEGARFKAMGVMAGVADLLFFWRDGVGAIELKAGKNTATDTQIIFKHRWLETGGNYAECRSLEDVRHYLELWGAM